MHFPYEEDEAGVIRGRHKTSDASEYLLAEREIIALAKDVLSEREYSEAEEVAKQLTGKKRDKDLARARLVALVKLPPKRPIYYAQYEMLFLPRWTRNALRYLGDFIDMLVKSAVYEKINDRRVFGLSLGPAINQFQRCWPSYESLVDSLQRYNRFLYRGAKHDFTLPAGRKTHRFTAREVVLTAFITMNLADKIVSISYMAKEARNDKMILR
jgi:hypothetical protein